jgi:hypothetical protein
MPIKPMIQLVVIGFVLFLWAFVWALNLYTQAPSQSTRKTGNSSKKSAPTPTTVVRPENWTDLVLLVGYPTAERLLKAARKHNPEKDDFWTVCKLIADVKNGAYLLAMPGALPQPLPKPEPEEKQDLVLLSEPEITLPKEEASTSPKTLSIPNYLPKRFQKMTAPNFWKLTKVVDAKTAERLLQSASLRYPDKSNTWLVDKVLWDLERDRSRA